MKGLLKQEIDFCLKGVDYLKNLDLANFSYSLTWSKHSEHGDFACNVAMLFSKVLKLPPVEIATKLKDVFLQIDIVDRVEVAGPGFINIYVKDSCFVKMLSDLYKKGPNYCLQKKGFGETVHLEYVSANPTGPLHVGHGRGAALGSALANILSLCGYEVHQEYYVNDAGRQMSLLGLSCFVRILQQEDESIVFPVGCYKGEYVKDIAKLFVDDFVVDGSKFVKINFKNCENDGDLDSLITDVVELWGESNFSKLCDFAGAQVLKGIKDDLQCFGVSQKWFSEKDLLKDGFVERMLEDLWQNKLVYEEHGALWFKSSLLGDDKDRVLQRANKNLTYFATDAAYHGLKFKNYKNIINIWGADHHGYVARVEAVVKALGFTDSFFKCLLVQFVSLVEGKNKVSMSTRSGDFVTLRQLIDDVGVDVCRFFYLMRKSDQHIDFDLQLARKSSQENPVFYIQYAHARVCSILRQVCQEDLVVEELEFEYLGQLGKQLLACLAQYNEVLVSCVDTKEVYLLAVYLQSLAACLHKYYNSEVCLVDDLNVRNSRLILLFCVKLVLSQGLTLLGVSCPEKM